MIIHQYRRDWTDQQGMTIIEQTDQEVVVGHWKPVDRETHRRLEAFHGRTVTLLPVQQDRAAIHLALSADNAAIRTFDDAPEMDERRLRNLPPGEALLQSLLRYLLSRDGTDLSLWKTSRYRWRCAVRLPEGLTDLASLDERSGRVVVRLLKEAAGLDLLQEREPQDGRATFPWLPDRQLRVATVGAWSGEAVAVRVLGRVPRPLGTLGFPAHQLAAVAAAAQQNRGLIVCCGATGSGKTTTAAALVEYILRSDRKVVSIEDPVEYHIPGVLQLSGDDPRRIAAVLRQDPDVIWIGEARHKDHVATVGDALLTGHLVVTTLHAGTPRDALARFASLGLSPEELAGVPVTVIMQQLAGAPRTLTTAVCRRDPHHPAHTAHSAKEVNHGLVLESV